MKKSFVTIGLLIFFLLFTFGVSAVASPNPPATIYYNGTVVTVDEDMSYADAVAVRDGKIIAVGKMGDVLRMSGPDAIKINLQGRSLLPGFYDAHGHFGGSAWRNVNLGSGPFGPIRNMQDLIDALAARADSYTGKPDTISVIGSGYDDIFMAEQRHPTVDDLDQAADDRPIVISHFSGHATVINSFALAQTAVDYNGTVTPNPEGGIIGRFADTGKPNGQFFGNARSMYVKRRVDGSSFNSGPTSPTSSLEDIQHYSEVYAAKGTTTANSGGGGSYNNYLLFKEAADKDYLKIRALLWFGVTAGAKVHDELGGVPAANISRKLPQYAGKKSLVVAGGIKLVADGSPQLRTAFMTDPYLTPGDNPAPWMGITYMVYASSLLPSVQAAHRAGFDSIHIHDNGDRQIDEVLDAYEFLRKNEVRQSNDYRHVLIHCQFSREDQFIRMNQLGGIIPSFLGCISTILATGTRKYSLAAIGRSA